MSSGSPRPKPRTAETLFAFFDELGDERLRQLETVTVDMGRGYLHALTKRLPAHVNVVFDRFHVQRLASDAVDKLAVSSGVRNRAARRRRRQRQPLRLAQESMEPP